jgi:hypothetical protein
MHTIAPTPRAATSNAAIKRMTLWSTFLVLAFASVFANAITLTAVQSRKAHGATNYDLAIDTTQAIGGAVTVESRAIGAGHHIVFQFDAPVTTTGVPSAADENGASVATSAPLLAGNDVAVTITDVADNKRVKVVLPNVNGGSDAIVALGFLVGDVNNSRTVSANDLQQMKSLSGQGVDAANFRFDLNTSGAIGAADIVAVKSRSPRTLVEAAVPAAFTTQPGNATVTEGQTAQFAAAASGTPAPTLRWQLSTDSGANWSDIAGATVSPLNIVAALSDSGRRYRAVATNIAGSVNSNAATLTVNATPVPKAWQAAARISAPIFGDVYNYQIASSANGDAIAVWQDLVSASIATNIWASRYTPSTGWGVATIIDAGPYDARDAQVGMDANGNAIVIWSQSNGVFDFSSGTPVAIQFDIWSNRYVPGTGWTGATLVQLLGGSSQIQLAVATNGQAVATWSQRNATNSGVDSIARSYHPATGWGATTTLATGTDAIIIVGGFGVNSNPGPAKVAMDASGNSMAIWTQLAGTQINLMASRNSGPTEMVKANTGLFVGSYNVASNGSGETFAVWGERCIMWANRYVPGTGWGTATALQTGNPTCTGTSNQIAVADNGDAIAAWQPGTGAMGNRYSAGSGWLGASPINNSGLHFQFAMNGAGKALAVWRSSSILAGNNDYVAGYNFFPSVLVYGDSGLDSTGLRIAMDANGNAIALFKRGGDGLLGNTIWAAVYK